MQSAQHLRLFAVDTPADTPNAAWPLTLFWRAYARPICYEPKAAAPRTLQQIAESLRLWEALTGDPPLARITQATCAAFLRGLHQLPARRPNPPADAPYARWIATLAAAPTPGPTMARNTVLKHARTIQRLLDLAGPRGRRNRSAADLLATVPWLDTPAADPATDCDPFTIDELAAWIAATATARYPSKAVTGILPGTWWRTLLLFLYNSGLRIGTALAARWSWLDSTGSLLRVPAAGIKRRRVKAFYLNTAARDALATIATPARALLWPFPGWPRSESYLRRRRLQLQAAAGLPPHRRLGFHAIRATAATAITELTGDLSLAQLQLGHSSATVTANHYTALRRAARRLDDLPQPT